MSRKGRYSVPFTTQFPPQAIRRDKHRESADRLTVRLRYRTAPRGRSATHNRDAYDATIIAAYALRAGGLDRRGVRDALPILHDVPSVVFGKATFDPVMRRVIGVKSVNLVVENGQWALLGSKAAVAAK